MLELDGGIDSVICDFPHGAGGGWADVDPNSAFFIYAQMAEHAGIAAGTAAMATGNNKVNRVRAVCLALVMAVAINKPELLPDDKLASFHQDLPAWVAAASLDLKKTEKEAKQRVGRSTSPSPRRRSKSRRPRSRSRSPETYEELAEPPAATTWRARSVQPRRR